MKGFGSVEFLRLWSLDGLGGAAIAPLGFLERTCVGVWNCGDLDSVGECWRVLENVGRVLESWRVLRGMTKEID